MSKFVTLHGFGGSGDVELNFDIVAYATEEELLADTPAENTIGVVTTTPITGYKFSATEPENMNNGEVWIYVGNESNAAFDIIEDVTVYPLSAKQYIGGAWVDVTAKSYQGGKWYGWMMYLYKYGNNFKDLTGGWKSTAKGEVPDNTGAAKTISIQENNTSVSFTCPNDWYAVGMVWLQKKIDLTNFKTITANGTVYNNIECKLGIWSDIGSYIVENRVASISVSDGMTSMTIENLSGEYHVGFSFNTGANGGNVTLELLELFCE